VLGDGEPHGEVELTADPGLALEPETAAHHLDELRRDGETEAGAAVSARRRRVGLDERPEDLPPLVLGHADARVSHRAAEQHVVVAPLGNGDLDAHLALVGELDRVADQVEQDLTEASRIAGERRRHVRRDAARQLQPLLIGARRQQLDAVFDGVADGERHVLEREPARLDLRDVEDVVDDRHQRLRRLPCRAQVLALPRCELRLQREIGHADDGVHRRADLVTHVGQELALGHGGRLGAGARALQFLAWRRLLVLRPPCDR
jgi:hypothetical protein